MSSQQKTAKKKNRRVNVDALSKPSNDVSTKEQKNIKGGISKDPNLADVWGRDSNGFDYSTDKK